MIVQQKGYIGTVSSKEGLLTLDSHQALMRIRIKNVIMLLAISSALVGFSQAASCGGSCAIGSSYDFLGDPSIGMDTSAGLNQANNGSSIQSIFGKLPVVNGLEITTPNKEIIKIGASGMMYKSMPTLAFTTLRNKF